jgi:hypothetical protein
MARTRSPPHPARRRVPPSVGPPRGVWHRRVQQVGPVFFFSFSSSEDSGRATRPLAQSLQGCIRFLC